MPEIDNKYFKLADRVLAVLREENEINALEVSMVLDLAHQINSIWHISEYTKKTLDVSGYALVNGENCEKTG